MANHPSAQKRNRQNIKRNTRNSALRKRMRTALKRARDAAASNAQDKDTLITAAVREVYRAASKKVLKPNAASRTVSRLMSK